MLPFYNVHHAANADTHPDNTRAPFRAEPDWAAAKVLIYQGALQSGFRGIEEQIEAVRLLQDRNVDVRLVLVGYGSDNFAKDLVRELKLERYVKIYEAQTPAILASWLRQGDFAAALDLDYGLTSKTFEYLAAGLRVFAADYATDVISVCGNFVTVFGNSPAKLASAIETSLTSSATHAKGPPITLIKDLWEKSRRSFMNAISLAIPSASQDLRY